MASVKTAKLNVALEVVDTEGNSRTDPRISRSFPVAATAYRAEQVTIPNAGSLTFTAPTGAQVMVLELPPGSAGLTLKGSAGDTGIPLTPSSNSVGLPLILPLGASPVVILANSSGSSVVADLTWA